MTECAPAPSTTTAEHSSSLWPGFEHIEHIIVFGDSYSAVGYDSRQPHPTRSQPLGIPMPGVTWTEKNTKNWVGHLVKSFKKDGHDPRVLCYAVGGDRVAGVGQQITRHFLPSAGTKPDWAPWTSEQSLFITWVGTNDLGWGVEAEPTLAALFQLQDQLYATGARNFLFIDVPPVNRFPGGPRRTNPSVAAKYSSWNTSLHAAVERFRGEHADVSAFVFSSFAVFSDILDNPSKFGFKADQAEKPFSDVWVDHIHPKSAVHKIIARELAQYLYALEPKSTLARASTSRSNSAVNGGKLRKWLAAWSLRR